MRDNDLSRPAVAGPEVFHHIPVLLEEVMDGLNLGSKGTYVDCTAGGGGHSLEILKRTVPGGLLIALDQDPEAVKAVSDRKSVV